MQDKPAMTEEGVGWGCKTVNPGGGFHVQCIIWALTELR